MSQSVLREKNVTLLDLLDRILDKGVVLSGDAAISIAQVDLVYVGLRVFLSSVEAMEARGIPMPFPRSSRSHMEHRKSGGRLSTSSGEQSPSPASFDRERSVSFAPTQIAKDARLPLDVEPAGPRADSKDVENGLAKLVLTLIELLRRLMERQAVRRVEGGSLSDEEVERLGETLMGLDARMRELKVLFGLEDEDLNLDLGPLGDLM